MNLVTNDQNPNMSFELYYNLVLLGGEWVHNKILKSEKWFEENDMNRHDVQVEGPIKNFFK